jgi:hypothetical protein
LEERQSLNSLDQFSNQENLDSYLDPRGLSGFQNYARRPSEVSWMSRTYFTSNESNDILNCYDYQMDGELIDFEDKETERSLSLNTIPSKRDLCVPERNTNHEGSNNNQKT